jgi:hypothetical protein
MQQDVWYLDNVDMNTLGRPEDRREHDRVPGPFDGLRVDLLDTPVRIYDLSKGGCFVHSMHEQTIGIPVTLKIDLPFEGWITVEAEVVYRKDGFGFAVRFQKMDAATTAQLSRSVDKLLSGSRT